MRDFFLSNNTNYPFELFGFQHCVLLLITMFAFLLMFVLKKRIMDINNKKFRIIRIVMGIIIFFNMFIYRVSYMYYDVYDIKIHLSLYYCHIVNYLFVISLIINYKLYYKMIYILTFIGSVWAILFPQINEGIDCFIFYTTFICHNLLSIFVTFIMCNFKIKMHFLKDIKYFIYAILIVLFTYLINIDLGTNYNEPNWPIFNQYVNYYRYIFLLLLGFIGYVVSFVINKVYIKHVN